MMALFVCTKLVTTTPIFNFVNMSRTSFVNDRANCGFPSVAAVGSFKHTPPLTAAMANSATSRSFVVTDRDCGFSIIAAAGHQLARIKWTPLATSRSRSFVIKVCGGLPVDGGGKNETTGGGEKEVDIDSMRDKKEIDFATIFRIKEYKDDDDDELSFDSEFTGEKYLDYIAKLIKKGFTGAWILNSQVWYCIDSSQVVGFMFNS